jgi:hypothetical protein
MSTWLYQLRSTLVLADGIEPKVPFATFYGAKGTFGSQKTHKNERSIFSLW